MKIINVGYDYRHPSGFCINRPYGSGDYLLLIIKTEAFFTIDGKRCAVQPGSAIIFKKGSPQIYSAADREYVNDWIHFDMDEAEEAFVSSLGVPFDTIIPLYNVSELLGFIKNIFFEMYSRNLRKEAAMKRYFELILLKLSENMDQKSAEREHLYYEAFCHLRNEIRLVPQKHWTVDEISKEMNLSRSYVQHLYKLFFGTSIISDIQSHRMEHAKYLLSATDMTVNAVSLSCGYDNGVHFMRVFKGITGMTPSAFRNAFRVSPNEMKQSKSRPPFSI